MLDCFSKRRDAKGFFDHSVLKREEERLFAISIFNRTLLQFNAQLESEQSDFKPVREIAAIQRWLVEFLLALLDEQFHEIEV